MYNNLSTVEIIQKKISKKKNTPNEINWLISNFVKGNIPNYQMSAWLMAVNFLGMSISETAAYTKELINSGEKLKFENNVNVVDKHSSGGVGDKVSLIIAPMLATMGYKIPMIAGRSLEHTGGTIDKLESIPRFKTNLKLHKFKDIVNQIGLGIIMQTDDFCPADGKIYALRDVTSTVNSFPLICGSILSKKISEGISKLVMDIKIGNGAFMSTSEDGQILGNLMKKIGEIFNIDVVICFTGMDQPLGKSAGIWCEIIEAYEFLKGNYSKDLYDVVLHLFKKFNITKNKKNIFDEIIKSGSGLNKFGEFIETQGGNFNDIESNKINKPKYRFDFYSEYEGIIKYMNTKNIGFALSQLGAGRPTLSSNIDPSCGAIFHFKIGQHVMNDLPLFSVFGNDKNKVYIAKEKIKNAIIIASENTKLYNPIIQ